MFGRGTTSLGSSGSREKRQRIVVRILGGGGGKRAWCYEWDLPRRGPFVTEDGINGDGGECGCDDWASH